MEKEITYNGHTYRVDGENLWQDGVLLDKIPRGEVKFIKEIKALQVDDYLYFNNSFYKKVPAPIN